MDEHSYLEEFISHYRCADSNELVDSFLSEKYQSTSGIHPGILSLILVLSRPYMMEKYERLMTCHFEKTMAEQINSVSDKAYGILSGGKAEGCHGGLAFNPFKKRLDDTDFMICIRDYSLLNISGMIKLDIHFDSKSPVYMKIYAVTKYGNKVQLKTDFISKVFLPSIKKDLNHPLGNIFETLNRGTDEVQHSSYEICGPAFKSTHPHKSTSKEFQDIHLSESDLVYCLELETHHVSNTMTRWASRHRSSKWPGEELLDKVQKMHCHAVPVGPNRTDNNMWRLSFSAAETFLIQNCGYTLRLVYTCGKVLIKQYTSISTYLLKTSFLWLMEEVPRSACVLSKCAILVETLLKRLLLSMAKRHLSHYFKTENNLLSGIPVHMIWTHQKQLLWCLANLGKAMLSCTDLKTYISAELQSFLLNSVSRLETGQVTKMICDVTSRAIENNIDKSVHCLSTINFDSCSDLYLADVFDDIPLFVSLIHECQWICTGQKPLFHDVLLRYMRNLCRRVLGELSTNHCNDESLEINAVMSVIFYKELRKITELSFSGFLEEYCQDIIVYLMLVSLEFGRCNVTQCSETVLLEQYLSSEDMPQEVLSANYIYKFYKEVLTGLVNQFRKHNRGTQAMVEFIMEDFLTHFHNFLQGNGISASDPLLQNNTVRLLHESTNHSPTQDMPDELTSYAILKLKILLVCFYIREGREMEEAEKVLRNLKAGVLEDEFLVFSRHQKALFSFSGILQGTFETTRSVLSFVSINVSWMIDTLLVQLHMLS